MSHVNNLNFKSLISKKIQFQELYFGIIQDPHQKSHLEKKSWIHKKSYRENHVDQIRLRKSM